VVVELQSPGGGARDCNARLVDRRDRRAEQPETETTMEMKRLPAVVVACSLVGTLGCNDGGRTDLPPGNEQSLSALPQESPGQEIVASAATTGATGVARWRMYENLDPNSTRIYGVNAADEVVTVMRIGAPAGATDPAAGVVVESLYPQAAQLHIDGKGQATRNELTGAPARTFAAMAADFKAAVPAAGVNPQISFACIRADALLVGACGVTIAGCLETFGLGCVVGSVLCYSAYQDWLCACHHINCF
jgi:hypothetical protein